MSKSVTGFGLPTVLVGTAAILGAVGLGISYWRNSGAEAPLNVPVTPQTANEQTKQVVKPAPAAQPDIQAPQNDETAPMAEPVKDTQPKTPPPESVEATPETTPATKPQFETKGSDSAETVPAVETTLDTQPKTRVTENAKEADTASKEPLAPIASDTAEQTIIPETPITVETAPSSMDEVVDDVDNGATEVAKTSVIPQQRTTETPAEPSPKAEPVDPVTTDKDEPVTVSNAPSFSLVRVEGDGAAVIAGVAGPDEEVEVLLDGEVVGSTTTGADGKFALLLDLAVAAEPRIMELRAIGKDVNRLSDEQVIITASPEEMLAAVENAEKPQIAEVDESTTEETDKEAEKPQAVAETTTTEEKVSSADSDDIQPVEQNKAPKAPAVLLSDATGVKVVQPSGGNGPEADKDVFALDSISYSDEGAVQITGRSASDGGVRIYLNNNSVGIAQVAPGGHWTAELLDVQPGVYTLRADRVADSGKVLDRVETPFKREAVEALTQLTEEGAAPVHAITVQPGNTLWAIARDRYGEGTLYVRVFEANKDRIKDPDLIYPGQIFDLPSDE